MQTHSLFSHISHLAPESRVSSDDAASSTSDHGCDVDSRDLSLPPFPPPYQHYSDLRTTTKLSPNFQPTLLLHEDFFAHPCCCEMDIATPPSTCDECVQECEEGDCELELTAQCTDKCVVVPCHDEHHELALHNTHGADLMCVDTADCGAFDNFVSFPNLLCAAIPRSDEPVAARLLLLGLPPVFHRHAAS